MHTNSIVLTGGHLSPAVAFASFLTEKEKSIEVIFIGRKHFFSESQPQDVEQKAMKPYSLRTYAIDAGRSNVFNPKNWIGFISGLYSSFSILKKERPRCVVSFGGYVAVPICLAARILHIPIILHEQTLVLGRANRMLTRIASEVCLAFPLHTTELPKHWHITGLPIREQLFQKNTPSFSVSSKKPLLYITGGTTGAVSLNELLFPILPELLKTYQIIHQTGTVSFSKAKRVHAALPEAVQSEYHVYEYITVSDVSWIYQNAHLCIARSGANTVYELALLALPAILLPLPWSVGNEQLKNAEWLEKSGGVQVLVQTETDAQSLLAACQKVEGEYEEHKKKAQTFSTTLPKDGQRLLFTVVQPYVS